jgi:hypothetical protein
VFTTILELPEVIHSTVDVRKDVGQKRESVRISPFAFGRGRKGMDGWGMEG